jgi:hypothetical protein
VALTVGDLLAYLRLDRDDFKRGLRAAHREMVGAGDDIARESRRTGRRAGEEMNRGLGEGLKRNSAGRLIDAETGRFVKDSFGQLGQEAGKTFGQGLRDMMSAGANLATNIWNWVAPVLAFTAAVAFAGPVVSILGGALGSLFAIAAGAGLGLGVLGLGLRGVADAFKKTSAGGGSAVNTLRQVELAQRAVARAQRDAKKAADDLNRARENEVKRIRDLNLNLRQSLEDQKSAAAAISEAREALARARATGDANEIAKAEADLRRAELALEETKNRVSDLKEEQAEADRKGVEGSDQVQAAIERQQQALEALADAEYNLKEARKGGGGGGGGIEDTVKLAPAAEDFVSKIKKLGPAFDSIRLDVQEHLFRGLGDSVTYLFNAWKPTLTTQMVAMADVLNGIVKTFSSTASKPRFISDMSVGLDAVRRLVDRVGTALAGPFMDAMARLSRAAAPFVDMLGDKLGGMIEDFASWIEQADNTGQLEAFFRNSTKYVGELFDIVSVTIAIVGDLFSILLGKDLPIGESGKDPLAAVRDALQGIHEWLQDPENQKKLQEVVDKIRGFLIWLFNDGVQKVKAFWKAGQEGIDKLKQWKKDFDLYKQAVEEKIDSIQSKFDRFKSFLSGAGIFNSLWESFKWAINQVIYAWNRLSFSIPRLSFMGIETGGGRVDTPDITPLATGGIVQARTGGMIARVAEGGEDELVAPLSKAQAMFDQAVANGLERVLDRIATGDVIVTVDGEIIERKALAALRKNAPTVAANAKQGTRTRVFAGGASAQLATTSS